MRFLDMTRNLLLCCLLWFALPLHAHEGKSHEKLPSSGKPALAASVAFDPQGRLWRVTAKDGRVLVDHSSDKGKSFSTPVAVNPRPEKIGSEGELRPKIAFGKNAEIYVTWTQALDQPYAGNIRFSRSLDGGLTFAEPVVINRNRDAITHRFDSLAVADNGTVYVAWIDKRDLHAAQAAGKKYDGAAIYYAVSRDHGATFDAEYKVADGTCECCRIGLVTEQDGSAAIFWRHVYEGSIRDHAIARVGPSGVLKEPVRVGYGNWRIDACPHHGPAIARGGDWGWHLAWFDGAEGRQGLYHTRIDGSAWVAVPARRFGNSDAQAGHPWLLSAGEQVFLVWKELTAESTVIQAMVSDDGGRTWGEARKTAETAGAADNPFLVSDGQHVYLSWNTRSDGYRLIELGALRK